MKRCRRWFIGLAARRLPANFTLAVLTFSCCGVVLPAQQATLPAESATCLSQYELICYCDMADESPENIIRLNNNGDILFATAQGKTREQLRAQGIAFAASQIELLKRWRLLTEEKGVLKAQVPISSTSAFRTHRHRRK